MAKNEADPEMSGCFEQRYIRILRVSNVETQRHAVTPLRSTKIGILMTHGEFPTVEQNKCRQCFDADPGGRGEPKLDLPSGADPRSVLESHRF